MADEALVALYDVAAPFGKGPYLVARDAEWRAERVLVNAWRGPEMPDEQLPRTRLREAHCETLLLTPEGYWDCVGLHEVVLEAVPPIIERHLEDLALMRVVESESYPEPYREDFGSEVWVVARSRPGDYVGVNGDLVSERHASPPRGYVETDRGGYVPSVEEEIERDWLYEPVQRDLEKELEHPVPLQVVKDVVDSLYERPQIYWSASAHVQVWVSKDALRLWEASLIRDRQERERQLELELARQARNRRRRRREAVWRGRGGEKHDWSPRGRIPGERD